MKAVRCRAHPRRSHRELQRRGDQPGTVLSELTRGQSRSPCLWENPAAEPSSGLWSRGMWKSKRGVQERGVQERGMRQSALG